MIKAKIKNFFKLWMLPSFIVLSMHLRNLYFLEFVISIILFFIFAIANALAERLTEGLSHQFIIVRGLFGVMSLSLALPVMIVFYLYLEILWNTLGITKIFGVRDGALRSKVTKWISSQTRN